MVKPIHIILAVLAIIGIIIAFNWDKFKSWISGTPKLDEAIAGVGNILEDCKADHSKMADDAPCESCETTTSGEVVPLFRGVIKNGVCTQIVQPPPSNTFEVTNPSGAFMYYRSPSITAGHIGAVSWGKSNVNYPLGTKLTIVKEYWTNNAHTAGYFETTNKKYGVNSGFVEMKDVKKI